MLQVSKLQSLGKLKTHFILEIIFFRNSVTSIHMKLPLVAHGLQVSTKKNKASFCPSWYSDNPYSWPTTSQIPKLVKVSAGLMDWLLKVIGLLVSFPRKPHSIAKQPLRAGSITHGFWACGLRWTLEFTCNPNVDAHGTLLVPLNMHRVRTSLQHSAFKHTQLEI